MMDVEEFASLVESFVNTGNFEKLEEAGKRLSEIHPTLQQNFMRLVLTFVEAEAESKYIDARNKATVELSKKIMEAIKDSEYYYNGKIYLPFI